MYFKYKKTIIVTFALICVNLCNAIPVITLTPSDNEVLVGESFDVSVVLSNVDPSFNILDFFGFLIESSSFSHVSFLGASVSLDYFPLIDDLTDPSQPYIAGFAFASVDVSGPPYELASLSFLAVSAGISDITISGQNIGVEGLSFSSQNSGDYREYPIYAGTNVAIQPVPDAAGFEFLSLAFIVVIYAGRKIFNAANSQADLRVEQVG